jgi:hypothetical protein
MAQSRGVRCCSSVPQARCVPSLTQWPVVGFSIYEVGRTLYKSGVKSDGTVSPASQQGTTPERRKRISYPNPRVPNGEVTVEGILQAPMEHEITEHEQWQLTAQAAHKYGHYSARYILGPWVFSLVDAARLAEGKRVLDVACGTDVVRCAGNTKPHRPIWGGRKRRNWIHLREKLPSIARDTRHNSGQRLCLFVGIAARRHRVRNEGS